MTSSPQVHHFNLIYWLKTSLTQGLINSEISNHQIRVLNYQGLKIRNHIWETLKNSRESIKGFNHPQIIPMTISHGNCISIQGPQSSISSGRQLGFFDLIHYHPGFLIRTWCHNSNHGSLSSNASI